MRSVPCLRVGMRGGCLFLQIHTQADLTRDGMKEVVIAREGGDLEVYARDDMGQMERIAKHAMG